MPRMLQLLFVLCAGVSAGWAQQQIEFSISAVDGKGNPVTDLKKEEISILDNGQARDVAALRFDGGAEQDPPKTLRPGVFTNRPEYLPGPPKNVIAIVVDALHTTAQAMRYLSAIGQETRVAVYQAGERLTVLRDFAVGDGGVQPSVGTFRNTPSMQVAAAMEAIGNRLAAIPGRRILIWIGSGTMTDSSGEGSPLLKTAQRLATQGIAVYPVDAKGLEPMAAVTGGRAIGNINDPADIANLVLADVRGAYTLRFYAPGEPDAGWHDVTVKTERRGVKLTCRQGYLAETAPANGLEWTDQEWTAAITSPLSSTTLRLDARCEMASNGSGGTLIAVMQIPDQDLHFLRTEGQLVGDVEFAIVERSAPGAYSTERVRAAVRIKDDPAKSLASEATQYTGRWKLNPETSSIRLIARDRMTGHYGTVDLAVKSVPAAGTTTAAEPATASPASDAPAISPGAATAGDDPFIEKARAAAMEFLNSLPNYVVKQNTDREVQARATRLWTLQDRISAEIVYEAGKETTRNVQLNGKPVMAEKLGDTGAWSTGQFGTTLRALFAAESAAVFHEHRGAAKMAGREARVYDFSVTEERSQWVLSSGAKSRISAYEGTIWLDRETARTLKFVMRARKLPASFPFDEAESSTEYGMVRIGSGEYLLPTTSIALVCSQAPQGMGGGRRGAMGGGRNCVRNVIHFRDYKQFGTETNIDFGPGK